MIRFFILILTYYLYSLSANAMQSSFAGMGLAETINKHNMKMDRLYAEQIAILKSQYKHKKAAEERNTNQNFYVNPLEDETSNIRKWMAYRNISLEKYFSMSIIERQRKVVDPLLEILWREEVANNVQLSGLTDKQLQMVKDDFFDERRSVYRANFNRR